MTIVEASPAMCRKMGHASPGDGRTDAGGGGQEQVAAGNGGDAVGQNAFAAMVIPVCFAMMTELPVSFEIMTNGKATGTSVHVVLVLGLRTRCACGIGSCSENIYLFIKYPF